MENGEKQNKDNEGKFQKVETVQSTGDKEIPRVAESELRNQIIFRCSHPNSFDFVDFRVEPMNTMRRLNGQFYNLVSDSCYMVHKHNLEMNHVLTHKKYEKTLQQWLAENDYNWCEIYRGWGVNRPKEDARKIIQGILNAVYKLHQNNSFHGCLHHPENFAMDSDELVIGGDHKEIKHISLIHSKGPFICLSEDCDLQMGMKNDIKAMSRVIFDQILGGKHHTSYPPDLQNLYFMLQDVNCVSINWEFIVNHPSLWHWKSRFSYIGRVWAYYRHTDKRTHGMMTTGFSDIQVRFWERNILSGSPLKRIYDYPGSSYMSTTKDLLRYLRNARFHYKDYDTSKCCYRYIDRIREADYLNEKFIELKTTGIAELFLVELYDKMRSLGLHFKI